MLKDKDEIIKWLDSKNIKNYKIDSDNHISVNGNVDISDNDLKEIPVQFNIVSGIFNCSYNNLTSLKGAPIKCYSFDCSHNCLTSFEYGPLELFGNLIANNNKINSLKDFPIIKVKYSQERNGKFTNNNQVNIAFNNISLLELMMMYIQLFKENFINNNVEYRLSNNFYRFMDEYDKKVIEFCNVSLIKSDLLYSGRFLEKHIGYQNVKNLFSLLDFRVKNKSLHKMKQENLIKIVKRYGIKKFHIKSDFSIDIPQDITFEIRNKNHQSKTKRKIIKNFEFKFNKVNGYFKCVGHSLTSLKNLPKECDYMILDDNNISSFKYCPRVKKLSLKNNKISNFNYLREDVKILDLERNHISIDALDNLKNNLDLLNVMLNGIDFFNPQRDNSYYTNALSFIKIGNENVTIKELNISCNSRFSKNVIYDKKFVMNFNVETLICNSIGANLIELKNKDFVKNLYCGNDNIYDLNLSNYNNLKKLSCKNINFNVIKLPECLQHLECNESNIFEIINEIPNTVEEVVYIHNRRSDKVKLNALPKFLKYFKCKGNVNISTYNTLVENLETENSMLLDKNNMLKKMHEENLLLNSMCNNNNHALKKKL